MNVKVKIPLLITGLNLNDEEYHEILKLRSDNNDGKP